MQDFQVVGLLFANDVMVILTILVAQLRKAVTNSLVNQHLAEGLTLKTVDDRTEGYGILPRYA